MVSELLNALLEKKTCTQFELADRLRTTPEAVMAGLEFLKKGGYVRQVCVQEGCPKKCAACPGGNAALRNSFSIWEVVK